MDFRPLPSAVLGLVLAASPAPAEEFRLAADVLAPIGFTPRESPSLGRSMFVLEARRVVLSAGMRTALVDGRSVRLPEAPEIRAGGLSLSSASADALLAALGAAAGEEPAPLRPADAPAETPAPSGRLRKVVIDPGHGGCFDGARGRSGLKEKEVTLDVALRLRALLEARGVTVVMTRSRDTQLSANLKEDLQRRVDIATKERPDLFLSIHANYAESGDARGFEIYRPRDEARAARAEAIWKGPFDLDRALGARAPRDEDSRKALAGLLVEEFDRQSACIAWDIERAFTSLPTLNRGVKEAGFHVIQWAQCPAVLVELEFVSNPQGERRLKDPRYRADLARRLAEAVGVFGGRVEATANFSRRGPRGSSLAHRGRP
jgi:N-acetylmuramoyl-L-alanine amidase